MTEDYDRIKDLENTLAAVVHSAGGEVRVPLTTIRTRDQIILTTFYDVQSDCHVYRTTEDPREHKIRWLAGMLEDLGRDDIEKFLRKAKYNDEPVI